MSGTTRTRHPTGRVSIAVCVEPGGSAAGAQRIAAELGLPLVKGASSAQCEMLLTATSDRLELRVLRGEAAIKGAKAFWVDLEALDITSGAGRTLHQPIAKAVGLRGKRESPVTVIEATAGWGKDAWLLASLGCRVLAVERSPIVAALLADGIARAGRRQPEARGCLRLLKADSRSLLKAIAALGQSGANDELPEEARDFLRPDIVYLDPMFAGAERRKTAEKYPMRVLRRLVGADEDARELFEAALQAATRRVVVKRPAKRAMDLGVRPSATHEGKGFCFDVYAPRMK